MLRVGEDLRRRAVLDHPPGVDDRHVVGEALHDGEVVGDQHHCHPPFAPQRVQEAQDLVLDGDVESRGRLIGEEQLRLVGERDRDRDPLAHAARQLVRVLAEPLLGRRDAHLTQQVEGPSASGGLARAAVDDHRLGDLVADPAHRIEGCQRILRHHPDRGPERPPERRVAAAQHVDAIDLHGARSRHVGQRERAHDRPQDHGLARAGLPDHPQRLPRRERQRHMIDRLDEAPGRVESCGQLGDPEDGRVSLGPLDGFPLGVEPTSGRDLARCDE